MEKQPCYPYEWCTPYLTCMKMDRLDVIQARFANQEASCLEEDLAKTESRISECEDERDAVDFKS